MEKVVIEAYLAGIFNGYMSYVDDNWDGKDYWEKYVQRHGLTDSPIGEWTELLSYEKEQKLETCLLDHFKNKPAIIRSTKPASLLRLAQIFFNHGSVKGYRSKNNPPVFDPTSFADAIPLYINLFDKYKINE